MFAISTKGRYATRAMLELALRNHESTIQLNDIAKAQRISGKYLGRLMAVMVSAGLVRSRRGKNGGFTLAKPPSEISILDILCPLEGPIEPAPCLDHIGSCRESDDCVTREVWMKTKDTLTLVLQRITLEDLVKKYREERNPVNGLNYYI
jgi:Rrf2 family transcriptional regulator, cysteine metabolism repressor